MEKVMHKDQIKHMVDRFLMWKLPVTFNPDNGISFDPIHSKGTPHQGRREPVGTNLLSADQATDMVRFMVDGMPASDLLAQLKIAKGHIEHMAAFIGKQQAGYSFEGLGEDMPGIEAAITAASR